MLLQLVCVYGKNRVPSLAANANMAMLRLASPQPSIAGAFEVWCP
jgi:hypothetical protein